jgi:hypothetical protein
MVRPIVIGVLVVIGLTLWDLMAR